MVAACFESNEENDHQLARTATLFGQFEPGRLIHASDREGIKAYEVHWWKSGNRGSGKVNFTYCRAQNRLQAAGLFLVRKPGWKNRIFWCSL